MSCVISATHLIVIAVPNKDALQNPLQQYTPTNTSIHLKKHLPPKQLQLSLKTAKFRALKTPLTKG